MTLVTDVDPMEDRRRDKPDVELGEDWVESSPVPAAEQYSARKRSRLFAVNSSPLARKIITFNLLALVILVAGVLYLNPFRDSLVLQREQGLIFEAHLVADVIEASASALGSPSRLNSDQVDAIVEEIDLAPSIEMFVFSAEGELLSRAKGTQPDDWTGNQRRSTPKPTIITDFLNKVWETIASFVGKDQLPVLVSGEDQALSLIHI